MKDLEQGEPVDPVKRPEQGWPEGPIKQSEQGVGPEGGEGWETLSHVEQVGWMAPKY